MAAKSPTLATRFLPVLGALALSSPGCAEGEGAPFGDAPLVLAGHDQAEQELAFPDHESQSGYGTFLMGSGPLDLHYEERAGFAIHQGDIITGRSEALTPSQRGIEGISEAAVRTSLFWEDGVVPYVLSPDLPDRIRDAFEEAAEQWEQEVFGLTFVPRTNEEDYVQVISQGGNWSYLGRVGGMQELSLATGLAGVAVHEIGHALGLFHEQSRADRDEHVTIHWDRLTTTGTQQFKSYRQMMYLEGRDIGDYDVGSIMHYGSMYYSNGTSDEHGNVLPTMTTIDGELIVPNREYLAPSDAEGVQFLYLSRFRYEHWDVVLAPV